MLPESTACFIAILTNKGSQRSGNRISTGLRGNQELVGTMKPMEHILEKETPTQGSVLPRQSMQGEFFKRPSRDRHVGAHL